MENRRWFVETLSKPLRRSPPVRTAHPPRAVTEAIAQRFGDVQVEVTENIARLRIVGMGMRSHSGVGARLFAAMADDGVNIENISTAEIVICILVPEEQAERALAAVRKTFNLGGEQPIDEPHGADSLDGEPPGGDLTADPDLNSDDAV